LGKVVKVRESWVSVFAVMNMRKADSSWRDVRVRQAANFAINREDLIRYATKGNGVIIPALLPAQGFDYNPDLTPLPFRSRQCAPPAAGPRLYADGLAMGS
jgi:ABC-type transport system substrate-binding protein